MDFSKHVFRSHMVGNIIPKKKTLTKKEKETLTAYRERDSGIGRELTEKQKETLIGIENKLIESRKIVLTDGIKKTLRELKINVTRGVKNFKGSPQTKKGLIVEKEIRDILSINSGMFFTDSKQRKSNEWVTGITDFDVTDLNVVPDIKASFSLSSFNNILEEKSNEVYLSQLDCYMELEEKKESLLIHVLVDTPPFIIEKDIRAILNNPNYTTISGELTDEGLESMQSLIFNHTFTNKGVKNLLDTPFRIYGDDYFEFSKSFFSNFTEMDIKERIHMIPHSFNQDRIKQRNESIVLAREYMNSVKPLNNYKINLIH